MSSVASTYFELSMSIHTVERAERTRLEMRSRVPEAPKSRPSCVGFTDTSASMPFPSMALSKPW